MKLSTKTQLMIAQVTAIAFILLFVYQTVTKQQLLVEYNEIVAQNDMSEEDLVYAEEEIEYLNLEISKYSKQIQDLEERLNPEPFKPKLGLTENQNRLCLAITAFTETNGEPSLARETMSWAIINRAIDPRGKSGRDRVYKNNVCGVAAAHRQYSGIGPYLVDIKDVVWGNITEFTPALAKKNADEMKAWRDIWKIAGQIIDGKLTRKTTATHFISFRGMRGNRRPEWIDYFMPVGTTTESGLHTLYRDYGYDRETGEIVYFTKAKPYNPNKHRY